MELSSSLTVSLIFSRRAASSSSEDESAEKTARFCCWRSIVRDSMGWLEAEEHESTYENWRFAFGQNIKAMFSQAVVEVEALSFLYCDDDA